MLSYGSDTLAEMRRNSAQRIGRLARQFLVNNRRAQGAALSLPPADEMEIEYLNS